MSARKPDECTALPDVPEFGASVAEYLTSLRFTGSLPQDFEVLNPYVFPEVRRVVTSVCHRFYVDTKPRIGIWGINPGRLGAGLTGLSFTDPVSLRDLFGVSSSITGRTEPSAQFIADVIRSYGGPEPFYRDVYVSALSPLGFLRDGKNVNFYDDPRFATNILPWIDEQVAIQESFGLRRGIAIILGKGKLQTYVERNLRRHREWDQVTYLEHPRYVAQYRRSAWDQYVETYVQTIRNLVHSDS